MKIYLILDTFVNFNAIRFEGEKHVDKDSIISRLILCIRNI
jgi:hypothetical protein